MTITTKGIGDGDGDVGIDVFLEVDDQRVRADRLVRVEARAEPVQLGRLPGPGKAGEELTGRARRLAEEDRALQLVDAARAIAPADRCAVIQRHVQRIAGLERAVRIALRHEALHVGQADGRGAGDGGPRFFPGRGCVRNPDGRAPSHSPRRMQDRQRPSGQIPGHRWLTSLRDAAVGRSVRAPRTERPAGSRLEQAGSARAVLSEELLQMAGDSPGFASPEFVAGRHGAGEKRDSQDGGEAGR
jgi:hypothetical protein